MNKQIIIRLIISFAFIGFALRILTPLLYGFFKKKLSGQNNVNDIDWLIKNQKEQLKSQYGLITPAPSTNQIPESKSLTPEIAQNISQHYSYSIHDSKINNFLEMIEKRKILNFLPAKFQHSKTHEINFLSQALLLFLIKDEIIKRSFTMSQVLAKKLDMSLYDLTMGVQIKILLHMNAEVRTEEQVFGEDYILSNFTEEKISSALDSILQKEAHLWAQGPSLLFEELSLYFHYASIVEPLPLLRGKNDYKTAALILGCQETDSLDEIKKKYKKLALEKHPDKISAQKLPPKLEKKGLLNFSRIQEAYEILCSKNS
jgi:DnaJ-domain-containing protein 1